MTDKHAIYSPKRHEITAYYTPVLSAQKCFCKVRLYFTEEKNQFQRNENSFLKLANILPKGTHALCRVF